MWKSRYTNDPIKVFVFSWNEAKVTGKSNTGHGNALTATLTIKVSSAFRKTKIKGFLYWAIKRSNFQEAMQSTTLQAEVTMMAVQFINVKRLFFLHKFFGPKCWYCLFCVFTPERKKKQDQEVSSFLLSTQAGDRRILSRPRMRPSLMRWLVDLNRTASVEYTMLFYSLLNMVRDQICVPLSPGSAFSPCLPSG